jgi:2'-5' RNA ligase
MVSPEAADRRYRRVILIENTSMPEPRAKGFSLWLMPKGATRERLAAQIERLAERLGTARFAPHVTLLAGIPGPESNVVDTARALAGELGPLSLEPSGVDATETHFRCLFFRVQASGALRAAQAHAARRFGREPDPSFDPHLSLVYGTLDAGVKAELSRELVRQMPAAFEARRLHVWRTEGTAGEWGSLASFGLTPDV